MLEKDIENLLARYIYEFLPGRNLKLIKQQMSLGAYAADLVFQEGTNSKLVIEIKRGLLRREAIGQIAVYYGLLREANPNDEIKLMLVANTIPKEFVPFLKEKMGVECLEIPVLQINEVAKKYNYTFRDTIKTIEEKEKIIAAVNDFTIKKNTSGVWIFQANPYRFDILNALADERLNEDVWMVNQYKNSIKKDDVALIWMSGKEAGIYAVADIISNPEFLVESHNSAQYWIDEGDKMQKRLRVKYECRFKFASDPVYRKQLMEIIGLANMAILKRAQGTNFPVSKEEWLIIYDFIIKKYAQTA